LPRLLVGLGNPGSEYEGTRHNVGFEAMDRLLSESGGLWSRKTERAVETDIEIEGRRVTLMKPLAYMNLSGGPVAAWARAHACERSEIVVYFDDVALPLGTLRLRERGSDGGHLGLASILEALGGNDVPRVRIGIRPRGTESSPGPLRDFVLSSFTREERPMVDETLDRVVSATKTLLTEGMGRAMARYNATSAPGSSPVGGSQGGRLA
jgi:PTH1 family peptidyl-tRNA hydrolase